MIKNLSNWYRPATFGVERDTIELRSQAIIALLENINESEIHDLVRIVFGHKSNSQDFLDKFRGFFQDTDVSFQSSGNDNEMLTLAGCALAACIQEGFETSSLAALSILTTSCFSARETVVPIDLIGMSTSQIINDSLRRRSRPPIDDFNSVNLPDKKLAGIFEQIAQQTEMANLAQKLREACSELNDIQLKYQKNIAKETEALRRLVMIQDEELQLLWWMIRQWSDSFDLPISNISKHALPIYLAIDTAKMTPYLSEAPSLKSIYYSLGLRFSEMLAIPEAINACENDAISKMKFTDKVCPLIFPIHTAINRAFETGTGDDWIPGWRAVCKIDDRYRISSLDLAMQLHRECKLLNAQEVSGE